MTTRHPFTDPISGRTLVLVVADTYEATGVEHPGCDLLANVSPDLDCFHCTACEWNGRISGRWFVDLWAAQQPCECGRVLPAREHHCWHHHADESSADDRGSIYCGECWHIYPSPAHLVKAYNRQSLVIQGPDFKRRSFADIYFCPLCLHSL